jgi:hypothetical protein
MICSKLKKARVIAVCGRTETSVNYKITNAYNAWKESGLGMGMKGLEKFTKQMFPRKPRTKCCIECGAEFTTLNYEQKRCVSTCKKQEASHE